MTYPRSLLAVFLFFGYFIEVIYAKSVPELIRAASPRGETTLRLNRIKLDL